MTSPEIYSKKINNMAFTPISELEQLRLDYTPKNNSLSSKIVAQNRKDRDFKDMQIIRFGDLVVAVHRPKKRPLRGGFANVYEAYPIQRNGRIDRTAPLMLKIDRHSTVELKNGAEEFKLSEQVRQTYSKDKPEKYIYDDLNDMLVFETKNTTRLVFSARITRIPQISKDGKTLYSTAILMSKVPGKTLSQLVESGFIWTLKPAQRLRLALNVIRVYQKLHAKGFYHRDIKAENIMIDPDTLQVTAIDLDNKSYSFTHAPEDKRGIKFKPNAQSDIYSLAIDILATILTGRELSEKECEKVGLISSSIIKALRKNFRREVTIKIRDMLDGMRAELPKDRIALKDAEAVLVEQLAMFTKNTEAEEDQEVAQRHQDSLRTLDRVLSDPKYNHGDGYGDGYCELITELKFASAQVAAEMVRDASQSDGSVKAEAMDKYNHIQYHIALLLGKNAYRSLTVSSLGDFEAKIVPVGTIEVEDSALEVDAEDQTEFLMEILEQIQQAKVNADKPETGPEKPRRVCSFQEYDLGITVEEKSSRIKQFSKTFNIDLLGGLGTKFVDRITKALVIFSKSVSEAKVAVSKNINALFFHTPSTTPTVTASAQRRHSI